MSNSINAQLPALCMGQPTEGDGYMIVARGLLRGVAAQRRSAAIGVRSCFSHFKRRSQRNYPRRDKGRA